LAHDQRDHDRADEAALEGIRLSNEAGVGDSLAASFRIKLGSAAWMRGDYERAKELLEESLRISREADDKVKIADALLELGGGVVWPWRPRPDEGTL
jgi:tetratricopeptide (TPR) repeat protein